MPYQPFLSKTFHEPSKKWHSGFAFDLTSIAIFDSFKHKERIPFINQLLDRQIDFISALACPGHEHTVELRYIAQPYPGDFVRGKITVALLVQVAGEDQTTSLNLAKEFYNNLLVLLRSLFEEYEWEPIRTEENFINLIKPFEFRHIGEILRRDDQVFLNNIRQTVRHKTVGFTGSESSFEENENSVYFVKPFLMNRNAMDIVSRILLQQEAPILLSICLQPTLITEEEEKELESSIERCEKYLALGLKGDVTDLSKFHPTLKLQAEVLRSGCLKQMLQLEETAFLLKIQIASPDPINHGVLDAIGVSMTEYAGSGDGSWTGKTGDFERCFSGGFDTRIAGNVTESSVARKNLISMTFHPWGPLKAPKSLTRLRYLFDINQASCAFRLPIPQEDDFPGIETRRFRPLPLPREMPQEGLHLGINRYQGVGQPIHLLTDDRRRHAYVVGQTGTGKSSFFLNMIMQDIKSGTGVGVIDPHGELIDMLLSRIPKERLDDVILINPSDYERPIGINLLEYETNLERDVAVNQMIEIFDKLYDLEKTGGPMFEQLMRNTLYLIMEDKESGATLAEVPRVLTNKEYRRYKISQCQNEYVKRFWIDEAERAGGDASLANLAPYITSKLTRFLYNDLIRPMVGQAKSSFDMREVMDKGKILLVSLSKGKLGETNSAFLGMLVIGKILAKALSRTDTPDKSSLKDFYLYVDEFQSVATDTFITILSEARKYKLNLTITNQYIHQIDAKIQNAIFGNVGTLISFRVGQLDAERLVKEFAPLVSQLDLMNLPNFHAYVTTLVKGEATKPFSMIKATDKSPVDEGLSFLVAEHSRMKYGRPIKEVEKEIIGRWTQATEKLKEAQAVKEAASSKTSG